MARVVQYFLRGLLVLVPIAGTTWVFVATFRLLDGWLGLPWPGLGLLVVVVATTAVGFLLSSLLARRLFAVLEWILDRLPIVRLVHGALRDMMSAFVGEKRRFDRPVAVELGAGVRALGFITRDSLEHLGLADDVAVYLPQAYNFAGQLLVVPRARLTALTIESASLMAFIVSGGVTGAREKLPVSAP